jgi:hypothetical protein
VVGRSLRFLRVSHKYHSLSRADVVAFANPPPLEWKFSLQEIANIESKASQFEKDLTAAIKHYSREAPLLEIQHPHLPSKKWKLQFDLFRRPEEEM